jgi:DNA-binding SARP family transcriptional activator
MMPSLSINLFGAFSAFIDEQPIENLGIKSQALLIYLAVERDHPHRRDSLFTLLWPGMPEKSARHNLNQAVYALR